MEQQQLDEFKAETREIISDLFNDGSDPNALYIIEHHIIHSDFDKLEKIAIEAFKLDFEVSDAEEFEEEGQTFFGFDILSEAKLTPELIDKQQEIIIPLVEKFGGIYDGWGTYFEDPNADEDEYGEDGQFLDDDE